MTLFLCIIFCFCFALQATADDFGSLGSDAFMVEEESSAINALGKGKYIQAREIAEKHLEIAPESFVSLYVMSGVFLEGEGNLIRGLSYAQKSLSAFEKKYCNNSEKRAENVFMQNWHKRLLGHLASVYQDFDDRKKQLEYLERLEELYQVDVATDKIWALMKLHRHDEAYAIIEKYRNSNNTLFQLQAYNGWIALEDYRFSYKGMCEAGESAVKQLQNESCVVLNNYARALSIYLKQDLAFEMLQRALKAEDQDCPSSPYQGILFYYLNRGEYQQAISAGKSLRKTKIERRLKVHVEKEMRSYMSNLFFTMGFAEKAESLMKTVVTNPDRQGYNSASKEQVQFFNLIEYYVTAQNYVARLEETLSAWGSKSFDGFHKNAREKVSELRKKIIEFELSLFKYRQEIVRYGNDLAVLRGVTLPYYKLVPFKLYGITETFGSQTVFELIELEKSLLTPEDKELYAPFMNFHQIYASWYRHDYEAAMPLIDQTVEALTSNMKLLQYQLKALKADILQKSERFDEASFLWIDVMEQFPAVIRMFDLRIPVVFQAESFDLASRMLARLKDSPRFVEVSDAPFVVHLYSAEQPTICLATQQGQRIGCSHVDKKILESSTSEIETVALIVDQFHQAVFSPGVDMTQEDMHSLDGRAVRIDADVAMKDLMKGMP